MKESLLIARFKFIETIAMSKHKNSTVTAELEKSEWK